ncbi:MAG TPA: DUF1837 domain-containing protein [Coriobacteriia bacterium]
MGELEDELQQLRTSRADELRGLLREVEYDTRNLGLTISGRFLYLDFETGRPKLDELLDLMEESILEYCIPWSKRAGADATRLADLRRKAAGLFVQKQGARQRSGEPAELLLYLLTDVVLGAPKVATKMWFKMHPNMVIHGADGIHLRLDGASGAEVYWGEAKLYGRLEAAMKSIAESISTSLPGAAGRIRDIDIVRDNCELELSSSEAREHLMAVLDPYDDGQLRDTTVVEHRACFAGFDYPHLREVAASGGRLVDGFAGRYSARVAEACNAFALEAVGKGLGQLSFVLLLLPFESVAELRTRFFERMDQSR